jgi:hypothetical protein
MYHGWTDCGFDRSESRRFFALVSPGMTILAETAADIIELIESLELDPNLAALAGMNNLDIETEAA